MNPRDPCDEIDRELRDLRARRTYLLDARKGPEDFTRGTELMLLDAREQTLLKRRSSRVD